MTKQKPSQRKALRSAAAKKGWETRRRAERVEAWCNTYAAVSPAAWTGTITGARFTIADEPPPPDPTPATPNWLHKLWAWLTGTA